MALIFTESFTVRFFKKLLHEDCSGSLNQISAEKDQILFFSLLSIKKSILRNFRFICTSRSGENVALLYYKTFPLSPKIVAVVQFSSILPDIQCLR